MAKETFYRWQNGKQRVLSSREVKQYIMRANNWTADQYQKQYDIFKNKLRAYESFKEEQGAPVERQSVVSVLFKEAKAKKQYGSKYQPSRQMQQIRSFSAYSITKGRAKAKQADYQAQQQAKYARYVNSRFGGFTEQNKGAQQIVDAFNAEAKRTGDPVNYVKMEKALSDYANKVHAKMDDQGQVKENQAIPYGQDNGGSPDTIVDFDIDAYL